jgi:Ca2+-binding RTX toxin-like protein
MRGNAGNDFLDGTSGNDSLFGGSGNDTLRGSTGTGERLDGGAGFDYLDLDRSTMTAGVQIDLRVGAASSTLADGTVISAVEVASSLLLGSGGDTVWLGSASESQYVDAGGGTDLVVVDYASVSGDLYFSGFTGSFAGGVVSVRPDCSAGSAA